MSIILGILADAYWFHVLINVRSSLTADLFWSVPGTGLTMLLI